MSHWRAPSRSSRWLGALGASAVTLGLLLMLDVRAPTAAVEPLPPAVEVTLVLALAQPQMAADLARSSVAKGPPPADRPRPARAASLSSPPMQPRTITVLPSEPTGLAPVPLAAEAAAPGPAVIVEAAPPASSPLRLDAQTLGRAIVGTEGAVRRMASESGTALDTPRATQSESLSSSVARGAVPDCLAPNAGGSLLSIPVIAYRAMKGQCK